MFVIQSNGLYPSRNSYRCRCLPRNVSALPIAWNKTNVVSDRFDAVVHFSHVVQGELQLLQIVGIDHGLANCENYCFDPVRFLFDSLVCRRSNDRMNYDSFFCFLRINLKCQRCSLLGFALLIFTWKIAHQTNFKFSPFICGFSMNWSSAIERWKFSGEFSMKNEKENSNFTSVRCNKNIFDQTLGEISMLTASHKPRMCFPNDVFVSTIEFYVEIWIHREFRAVSEK